MNTKHQYKGFSIVKREGNSARRGYKKYGYFTFFNNEKRVFGTLRDAKAFIDAKVGA